MPLIKMQTTQPIAQDQQNHVLQSLSAIVSRTTKKPEAYVMVSLEQSMLMLGGKAGNAALFDIRGIGGLTQDVNAELTKNLCQFCADELGIPADRVYATFTDVPRSNWGWNGNTF